MAEHTISLPESLYQQLLSAAQQQGLSPAQWIATRLPAVEGTPTPSFEFPADLIGSIDSSADPRNPDETSPIRERDAFGEYVIAKMAKQGIQLP